MKEKIIAYFRKNKFGFILIGIVFFLVLPIYINAKFKFSEIEKDGKTGIGKFVEYERKPKTRNYYFEYYNKNKKIKDLIVNAPDGFSKKVGSFYEIKYLDKFDDIIVNFDKEIKDTALILKAGFSIEDIEN
jgi:hypothetical protein